MFGLSQSTYIDTLLKWFNIDNFKKGYLSIGHRITLSKKDCSTTLEERESMSKILYTSVVGSIIYVMIYTRSDVAYSLGVVSRYQSDPGKKHWKIAKAILKYLRNTKDQWLIYRDSNLKLMRYTDFSFQSDCDDSRSMSGYVFTFNGGAICWKNLNQHTVVDSICEVEYIAAFDAAKEVVWLHKFIIELGVVPSIHDPILMYCDSSSAIAQVKEPKLHHRTKHVLHYYHLVWEIMNRDDVKLQKINGKENLTDPFTKVLRIKEFDDFK